MGWLDWYHLIKKYDGNLNRASSDEIRKCIEANPNDPISALKLAMDKYREETGCDVVINYSKLRWEL